MIKIHSIESVNTRPKFKTTKNAKKRIALKARFGWLVKSSEYPLFAINLRETQDYAAVCDRQK